ncbi:MAG: DUF2087 domain-containing protein [Caldisericaceae bacterium]
MEQIGINEFKKRVVDFLVRSTLSELPTKRKDKLIVLKAIALLFSKDCYTEKEVNEVIKDFLSVASGVNVDYVKIRRYLVDEEFLTREVDGSRYCKNEEAYANLFEKEISDIDLKALIIEAQRDIKERRKKFQP